MKPIPFNYQEPNLAAPQAPPRVDDLSGTFPYTAAVVPTWIPKTFRDSFAIYKSGSTYRFYVWDTVNKAWRYATLT